MSRWAVRLLRPRWWHPFDGADPPLLTPFLAFVVLGDAASLRRLAAAVGEVRAQTLALVFAPIKAPRTRGVSLSVAQATAALPRHHAVMVSQGRTGVLLRFQVAQPLSGVLHALAIDAGGSRLFPGTPRLGVSGPQASLWQATLNGASRIIGEVRHRDDPRTRRVEGALSDGTNDLAALDACLTRDHGPALAIESRSAAPIVDVTSANPQQFSPRPTDHLTAVVTARTSISQAYQLVRQHLEETHEFSEIEVVRADSHGWMPADMLRLAAASRAVVDVPELHDDSVSRRRAVAHLCAVGVPILSAHGPHPAQGLLPTELCRWLATARPHHLADELEREALSVRIRRAALEVIGSSAATGRLRAGLNFAPARARSLSLVLPTRRPALISETIAMLGRMRWPHLEIVIAAHGGLPQGLAAELVSTCPHRLRVIDYDSHLSLGEMLEDACHAADGELISKIDDDDFYSPYHITDLVQAWEYSGATIVGKPAQFVYLDDARVTVCRQLQPTERFGGHLAGGTLMLRKSDLFAIGGWRPLSRQVDTHLQADLKMAGGTTYRCHPFGYILVRHADGHTWGTDTARFLRDHQRQWRGLPRQLLELDADEPGFAPEPSSSPPRK